MANFEEIAKAARAKSQDIVDAEERAKRVKQEQEQNRLAKAAQVLRDNVLPVLNDAKIAFAADGIDTEIEETVSFRIIGGRGEPMETRIITIRCSSRLEADKAGLQVLAGDKYVFESDGSTITGKAYGTQGTGQTFPGGTFPDFIAPFVARALDSYYEKLRSRR